MPMADDRQDIPTRITLEPLAAPSILGLYGYAAATFVVAAQFAGWYGNARSELYLFPFAAMAGGLAQFTAAMWAYKARDGIATAMHGIWGSFWLAFGILAVLFAVGAIVPVDLAPGVGYWFAPLALFSAVGAYAAVSESAALATVWGVVAVASACAAIAGWSASPGWQVPRRLDVPAVERRGLVYGQRADVRDRVRPRAAAARFGVDGGRPPARDVRHRRTGSHPWAGVTGRRGTASRAHSRSRARPSAGSG